MGVLSCTSIGGLWWKDLAVCMPSPSMKGFPPAWLLGLLAPLVSDALCCMGYVLSFEFLEQLY